MYFCACKSNYSAELLANEKYILRCIELAKKGAGSVSPNPMVGCVIVYKQNIIGEGYHEKYGEAHAEVNAINSVKNKRLLEKSTLYVSLEPCAHTGLTPPCSDLIVQHKIPKVVIGTIDPFTKVAGKGIKKMESAGIKVKVGVQEKECRSLNKRFFTFHEKKRPYVFLKWAQTEDGFIDMEREQESFGEPTWITGQKALTRVHEMRAVEDAILVGTNTAEKDNPSLTVRLCKGNNPVRMVIDKNLQLPDNLNLFDGSVKTLVFNQIKNETRGQTEYVRITFSDHNLNAILDEMHHRKILSLIVEGGQKLLQNFIDSELWDEAHIYKGKKIFKSGIRAPNIAGEIISKEIIENDELLILRNH